MEAILPPTEKPHKEGRREERHKGQGLKKEWQTVMYISCIPQLQAAAGFSTGEVVVPAKSHRSRTLQEDPLSPHWPQQS